MRHNVYGNHGHNWIPSEQMECRRVRTASGSDRIIKPSSKIAEHKSHRDLIRGDCRDPVATACRRVRTASGSDRIIKPSSKSPEYKSHRDLIRGATVGIRSLPLAVLTLRIVRISRLRPPV